VPGDEAEVGASTEPRLADHLAGNATAMLKSHATRATPVVGGWPIRT